MPKPTPTFDSLLDNLKIVSEDIKEVAAHQPLLFIDAARYRVAMMRLRSKKEQEVDTKRSSLATKFRNRKDEQGKKIYTEGAVKEKVEIQTVVKQLRRELDNAFAEEELAKSMMEAYRQRNSALKIIADMQQFEGSREGAQIERDEQSRKLRNAARKLTDKRRSIASDD